MKARVALVIIMLLSYLQSLEAHASDGYGLTDAMRDQAGKEANTDIMNAGTSIISSVLGFITSIGVYLLIAGQFIMTMLDIIYITMPFLRGLLLGNGLSGRAVPNVKEGSEIEDKNGVTRVGIDWSKRCFISNDLKSLLSSNSAYAYGRVGISIVEYLKKRAFSIILVVLLIMLVVVSNIFVNTGMNVGMGILKMIGVA